MNCMDRRVIHKPGVIGVALTVSLFSTFHTIFALSPNDQHVRVQLVSEVTTAAASVPFWVGVHFEIMDGWHIYWRNPGDTGMPTRIEWTVPDGFQVSEIHWPFPERFEAANLVSFGYSDEVILLAKVTPPASVSINSEFEIGARVNWLECKEICLPGEAEVRTAFRVAGRETPNEKWAAKVQQARARVPSEVTTWETRAAYDGKRFTIHLEAQKSIEQPTGQVLFFADQPGILDYANYHVKKTARGFIIHAGKSSFLNDVPEELGGVLVSPRGWVDLNGARALHFTAKLLKASN